MQRHKRARFFIDPPVVNPVVAPVMATQQIETEAETNTRDEIQDEASVHDRDDTPQLSSNTLSYETDRFIASRTSTISGASTQQILSAKFEGSFNGQFPSPYTQALCQACFDAPYEGLYSASSRGLNLRLQKECYTRTPRKKALTVGRSLDLPNLVVDFYFNLLAWGPFKVYFALSSKLYSTNPISGVINCIDRGSAGHSSSAIACDERRVITASSGGYVQLYDINSEKRVAAFSTSEEYTCLVSDGRSGFMMLSRKDKYLSHYDYRANSFNKLFLCTGGLPVGMSFNNDKTALAMTIGDTPSDRDLVNIYDIKNLSGPRMTLIGHNGISKALAFSPFEQHKLITSGGITDKKIMLWDINSGKVLDSVQGSSQITGVHWVDNYSFIATEGFPENGVSFWSIKDNKISLIECHKKHSDRILYTAQNPKDITQFITSSAAEDLRFWSAKIKKETVRSIVVPSFDGSPLIR